ncbi:MAG TPA: cytochrome c oxidase subunit II, partial [bacterium]|nr:cytochrome c oxidase subunit II [bacterium]
MRKLRRELVWVTLVLVGLTAAACGSDSPSITDPEGPAAERINNVWWLMFGLATAVYVIVAALIIIASLRGRGTEGQGRPSRISEGSFIWIGGLIVPVVILAILAVVTVQTTDALRQPDENPLKIEVTAYQYWWAVRYPNEDITTANEIRVPAGRPVEMGLRSTDVLHSFWVP